MSTSTISSAAPLFTPPAQTNAQRALPTQPGGGPSDASVVGERQVGAPKAGQLQGLMQDHAEKDRLVNGMLITQGPARPSAAEAAQLRSSLGAVDTNVLRFASDTRLQVGVLNPGDDMFESGVLRKQDPKAVEAQAPQMAALTQQLNADLEKKHKPRFEAIEKKLNALPAAPRPAGFGVSEPDPNGPKRVALMVEMSAAKEQAGKEMGAAIDKSGLPIKPYAPKIVGPTGGFGAFQAQMIANQMPVSTNEMARQAGATTPEQIKQYSSMVEKINGPQLQQARDEQLGGLTAAISQARDPRQKAELQKKLAEVRANGGDIPIDHNKHLIMVPDLNYSQDGQGRPIAMDTHDTNTLSDWSAPGTTRVNKAYDPETRQGSGTDGQYFAKGGLNTMVVRDTAVGSAAVHELGHAIDFQMEKKDPQFYAGWKPRLEEAHGKASAFMQGKTVSEYAKTNPREYIAEGVSHYYSDPKGLKAADPALYALTEELLQRAGQLGARK